MNTTVVYLGPSLLQHGLGATSSVLLLPPIRRGDLRRLGKDVSRVLIIDGEFGQNLAVTPKEILELLDRGVAVYGAASMGALRAVELDAFGMTGIGWVYHSYRTAAIIADDEVAVAYDPETFKPLSVPLVNVRYWAQQLVEDGLLSKGTQGRLIAVARKIFFSERSPELLLRELNRVLGKSTIEQFIRMTGGITDIKQRDAELALASLITQSTDGLHKGKSNKPHNSHEKTIQIQI